MPLFGLEVSNDLKKEDFFNMISRKDFSFHYNIVSIIEIKWLIKKEARKDKELRDTLESIFSDVLRFLEYEDNIKVSSSDQDIINEISYELERFGHQDYFDTLILASAILSSDILLSEDEAFKELVDKQKERKSGFYSDKLKIYNWEEFRKTLL